ncbi:MAG: hypothetical protein WBA83_13930 [Burkholderiaceae bacterium]
MKLKIPLRPELFILAGVLWFAPGVAQELAVGDSASMDMSVRELMRLDADLALTQLKGRMSREGMATEAAQVGAASAAGGALKLVAIYGVGRKLLAEVMIGTRPYVYLHGKALAVGAKAGPAEYLLRGISGSCVHLERQQEAHTLCLHPGLWAAKP